MQKFKKIDWIVISVFLLIEMALYLSFLILDMNPGTIDTTWFKYSGVVLCLIFSIYCVFKKKDKISLFIPLALVFTLISDYFLLINTDMDLFIPGLATFIITQLIYFLLISYKRRKRNEFILNIILRILISAILIFVASTLVKIDWLVSLALIYFTQLLINFCYSVCLIKEDKKYLIFVSGLLIFIACDINVGLNNVHIIDGIDYKIVNYLMWLFYLPSQVLLACSNLVFDNKNIQKI